MTSRKERTKTRKTASAETKRMKRSAYTPTRDELLALARHWADQLLDLELEWFYYRSTGSGDWKIRITANQRLTRIAKAIGVAAVQEAIDWVEQDQRRRMGEEHWRIFTTGTEEEQAAVADEMYKRMTDTAESKPAKPASDK